MNYSAIEQIVLAILVENPQGIDAYSLIKALQNSPCEEFPKVRLTEHLPLFRANFLLFHCLYRLRDELWQTQQFHLEISPLRISLQPYQSGYIGLAQYDPMRAYFLDLTILETTTQADVAELLTNFWKKFHANDQRTQALATLELQEPVDYEMIKQQYRRLAMRYHPDRGGDHTRLQTINAAMAVLEHYYARIDLKNKE